MPRQFEIWKCCGRTVGRAVFVLGLFIMWIPLLWWHKICWMSSQLDLYIFSPVKIPVSKKSCLFCTMLIWFVRKWMNICVFEIPALIRMCEIPMKRSDTVYFVLQKCTIYNVNIGLMSKKQHFRLIFCVQSRRFAFTFYLYIWICLHHRLQTLYLLQSQINCSHSLFI